MERVSIDEIIAHCERNVERNEKAMSKERFETGDMSSWFMKEYWEHRQVAEYLKELKAYRDAEEQGLLLKLPCKVGDVVYVIAPNYNKCLDMYQCEDYDSEQYLVTWCEAHCPNGYKGIGVIESSVTGVEVWEDIVWLQTELGNMKVKEFGKTIFLTKEEAEQKLESMRKE